jgi:uncharacterized phage-associated protein
MFPWVEKRLPGNGAPMKTIAKTVRAADVAAYILKQRGAMEQIKLHKLLYYCQAGSLAWNGTPLFLDPIEAWINGPVVPAIWNLHRYEYTISEEPSGDPGALDCEGKRVVDTILKAYGDFPPYQIVQLTHGERPWQEARSGLRPNERGSNTISRDSMRILYSEQWA